MVKIFPDADKLRQEIIDILKNETIKGRLANIQTAMKTLLSKYDITGFAVYSEIRDMMNEGILIIDNNELDNNSVISINTFKKEISKENERTKIQLLRSFDLLEHQIMDRIHYSPLISLHGNYDFATDRNNFINKKIKLCLIGDNNPETHKFISNENFEKWYITKLPTDFKFILGNYGLTVKALEKGI